MVKVITYGTYDMLHYGHIRLLERAKALGDYLIVGVTSDDYDKTRGKINIQQPLEERIEAIRKTGLADKIVVEEYEGQKIDDIKRYGVDIFAIGSDWRGYFDYIGEYCEVVYLERTQGISSSEIRSEKRRVRLGLAGTREENILYKHYQESGYVDGLDVTAICTGNERFYEEFRVDGVSKCQSYEELLDECDAVYLLSHPKTHYREIREALEKGKHVLCEAPLCIGGAEECKELLSLAKQKGLVLMPGIKTAYSTAYSRMLLQLKAGKIGRVVSVDATCTSMLPYELQKKDIGAAWDSICAWGPTAMLPVFDILGTDYKNYDIHSLIYEDTDFDLFSKVDFAYDNGVGTIKVGRGVKSEGELIVSGTKGYIYVPAPWWKMDYFELRAENPADNKRFFYQLDGEGIRHQLVAFTKQINDPENDVISHVDEAVTMAIHQIIGSYYKGDRNQI